MKELRKIQGMINLIHKEGKITIHGRDSQIMCETSDDSIKAIVMSPPYNFKKKYKGYYDYDDNLEEWKYRYMLGKVFRECYRVMKDDGVMFLNVGFNRDHLKRAWDVLQIAEETGLKYFQPVIWMKSFMGEGHHSPSGNPKQFYLNYEYIFILTKTDDFYINPKKVGIPFKDKSNLERFGHEEDIRDAGNIWFIKYETRNKDTKTKYTSMFPFELVQRCIDVIEPKKNDIILDPFCGSGTTLIVAEDNGLKAIGYDITFNIDEFKNRKKQYEKKKKDNETKSS